jgi:GNAT superfamily N-acetyltransferase
MTDAPALLQMEDDYAQVFRNAVGAPGFAFVEADGLTRIQSPLPTPVFNSVLSSDVPMEAMDDAIASMKAVYGAAGVPLLWRLGPATTHREEGSHRLAASGFHPAPPSAAILGDIPSLVGLWDFLPVRVRGVRVADATDYSRWFEVFGQVFGVPDSLKPYFAGVADALGHGEESRTQNLILERRGKAIAVCTTLYEPGQPFASVFNFAVHPDHRREGLGKYMLTYAAYRLRAQGCPAIGQFSTPEGTPFYLRVTSSKNLGQFENWVWMG